MVTITACPQCHQIIFPPQQINSDFWTCPHCHRHSSIRMILEMHPPPLPRASRKRNKVGNPLPQDWGITCPPPHPHPNRQGSRAWLYTILNIIVFFTGLFIIEGTKSIFPIYDWELLTPIALIWLALCFSIQLAIICYCQPRK